FRDAERVVAVFPLPSLAVALGEDECSHAAFLLSVSLTISPYRSMIPRAHATRSDGRWPLLRHLTPPTSCRHHELAPCLGSSRHTPCTSTAGTSTPTCRRSRDVEGRDCRISGRRPCRHLSTAPDAGTK